MDQLFEYSFCHIVFSSVNLHHSIMNNWPRKISNRPARRPPPTSPLAARSPAAEMVPPVAAVEVREMAGRARVTVDGMMKVGRPWQGEEDAKRMRTRTRGEVEGDCKVNAGLLREGNIMCGRLRTYGDWYFTFFYYFTLFLQILK